MEMDEARLIQLAEEYDQLQGKIDTLNRVIEDWQRRGLYPVNQIFECRRCRVRQLEIELFFRRRGYAI